MHKQALEIAGLESLQSLISRGCRLIAVAVPYSDFFFLIAVSETSPPCVEVPLVDLVSAPQIGAS